MRYSNLSLTCSTTQINERTNIMIYTLMLLCTILTSAFSIPGNAGAAAEIIAPQVANQNFIPVDGSNLKAKVDAAIRLGRAKGGRYWVAYQFDAKPGVMVEGNFRKGESREAKNNEK